MKSRMVGYTTTIATLLIAALPVVGHADAAMDSCINAFIEQHVPKEHRLIVRKIDTTGMASKLRTGPIKLSARGARSGKEFATATCTVDGSRVTITEADAPTKIAAAVR
jgi:hypothetical protein